MQARARINDVSLGSENGYRWIHLAGLIGVGHPLSSEGGRKRTWPEL